MAIFRIEKNKGYTVMSNYHLKDKNLSLKAKGLLSMMLSLPEDWNYSTRGLAAICKEGVDSIGGTLKELESYGYITRRKLRGRDGRISDTEYTIYERPIAEGINEGQEKEQIKEKKEKVEEKEEAKAQQDTQWKQEKKGEHDTALLDMDLPCMEKPYLAKQNTDKSDTDSTVLLITNLLNTNQPSTEQLNTPSFFPSGERKDGKKDINALREQIKQQIDYEHIMTAYNRGQIDEFMEIMMEVALSKAATIKIGRDAEYPTAFVQERFQQLDSSHIEKVLEGIKENTTRVWNTKAYLMAALFNAPSSTGNHYTMLVNHDRYGID